MQYEIYTIEQVQVQEYDFSGFELWWADFEEAGVIECYVAFNDDDNVLGFLTVNGDNQCIAIEVAEDCRGNGIAFALLETADCYEPERNENPEFWAKVEAVYS